MKGYRSKASSPDCLFRVELIETQSGVGVGGVEWVNLYLTAYFLMDFFLR
jgi:hypothetical protein